MNINPIRTEQDHDNALSIVEDLLKKSPAADSPEGELLEVMIMLVEGYENKHYPLLSVSPVEEIRFRMKEQGLSIKDLAPAIGDTQGVRDILNGSRVLTLPMIRRLHSQFGIPLVSLIGV